MANQQAALSNSAAGQVVESLGHNKLGTLGPPMRMKLTALRGLIPHTPQIQIVIEAAGDSVIRDLRPIFACSGLAISLPISFLSPLEGSK